MPLGGRDGGCVRPRWITRAAGFLFAAACVAPVVADPSPLPEWPDTVAAIGDSITTAAVPDLEHLSGENPELSWATGSDEVGSHRARIEDHNPEVTAVNVAVPGARIADAPAQAERVVASGADYVLFLLGANDLCAADPPSSEQFDADVRAALGQLETGLPHAHVYVVSIPDVVHLREVRELPTGAGASTGSRTCPPVLSPELTQADLEDVRARHETYNRILRDVCTEHEGCRHDGGVVAGYRFSAADVSSADFFHPSVAGQRRLAELTWRALFER